MKPIRNFQMMFLRIFLMKNMMKNMLPVIHTSVSIADALLNTQQKADQQHRRNMQT
jgi:hypothetical protein